MGVKIWVARDRFFVGQEGMERKPDNSVIFFSKKEDAVKEDYGEKVVFLGGFMEVSGDNADNILRDLGISLAPGEGPIPIEITGRRLDCGEEER